MKVTNAMYLRLSISDGDLGKDNKDESNSIESQRELIGKHIDSHEDLQGEIVEYIDDGYSGTNFDRPAFKRMIEDAKRGKIQTVIVKDLSRLGRDYIGVGDYLDQIFPVLGIRFIAVNSNYDSDRYKGRTLGLDMTVGNLVNTLYCRDISKKVKSAVHSKWKQGITTNANPPFGYVLDKNNSKNWLIDPEAAAIVREIFDKALEGWNTRMITDYLNEKEYPTPYKYRRMHGSKMASSKSSEKEVLWNTTITCGILKRYEYTGAFVHNKKVKVQPNSKAVRTVPECDRVVIEDGHDAIITKEEFYKAQEVIRHQRQHSFREPNNYMLKGKIRCGNCGLALGYSPNLYDPVFYCSHALMTGQASSCCKDNYSERNIESAVFNALSAQIDIFRTLHAQMKAEEKKKPANINRKLAHLRRKADARRGSRIRNYEAFADGFISQEEYEKNKLKISQDIKNLEAEIEQIDSAVSKDTPLNEKMNEFAVIAESMTSQDHLTEDMVKHFIEVVYVYDARHIEVKFRFEDLLRDAAERYGEGGRRCS